MKIINTDTGKAFEYACLQVFYNAIKDRRPAVINNTSSVTVAEKCYLSLSKSQQDLMDLAARSTVDTIFDLEPMILDGNDTLTLSIQPDKRGIEGDVRDIIITRKGAKWEIGFSLKHNHFAVKHSRLSPTIDFGKKWYGHPCSDQYFEDILPLFRKLRVLKSENKNWEDIPNKPEVVYRPLLQAFLDELTRSYEQYNDIPTKLVEYLLGEFDFYKVISIENQRITQLQAFNLHSSLSRQTKTKRSKIKIPKTLLPDRIINMEIAPAKNENREINTVNIYLSNGWQFSLRIHNASKRVEPSLKFDIQISGMPTSIMKLDCIWQ